MPIVVVRPKHFGDEDPLKLPQGEHRPPLGIVVAPRADIRCGRTGERMHALHQRAHEALDVPAKPRRSRRPEIET